jgi:hypothetical protein
MCNHGASLGLFWLFTRSNHFRRLAGGARKFEISLTTILRFSPRFRSRLALRRRQASGIGVVREYKVDRDVVLNDSAAQSDLFYKMFPRQVDQGPQKPSTFAWILSRCADGTTKTAPREVIHLLNTVREEEAKRIQHGHPLPLEDRLFDRSVFKSALPAVSKARLIQTIYAEYPDVETLLSKLKGEKTEHSVDSLASLWKLSKQVALAKAEELVEIGFFQRRGSRDAPAFWVPFLYRDALEMVQGKADE